MCGRGTSKLLILLLGYIFVAVSISQKPGYMPQKSQYLELSESRKTGVEGAMLQVNCTAHVTSPFESLKWVSQHNPSSNFNQTYINNTTVVMNITHLQGSHAGRYACVLLMGDDQEETAEFELLVKRKGTNTAACGITQFKCKTSKHCIFLRYRCDGKNDCEDGSDEDCTSNPCLDKFRCNNSRCVNREDLCNHVDNCGDFSDEGQACYEKPPTTAQPSSAENQFGWLKITVIASTVGLVILISFIVIMVYRVKMKRLREQRIARALERMYHQGGSGEPTSSGHGEEGPSDQHPFLPMTAQRHYGNIIVNVNNGVQYMPGYEYSLFMDAPPPYSEVGRSDSGESNAPPPPYSTIDRSTNQRQNRESQGCEADAGPPRQNISQFAVQNCLGGPRGLSQAGPPLCGSQGRGHHLESVSSSSAHPGDSEDSTSSENCGITTGTLPGISISSRFLQSLLGSHGQGSAGDTIPRSQRDGDGLSSEVSDGGLARGNLCTESQLNSAVSGGVGSAHGPVVNVTQMGASLQRSREGPAPVVMSHGTQTPRHRAHGLTHSNTATRSVDSSRHGATSPTLHPQNDNSGLLPSANEVSSQTSLRRVNLAGVDNNIENSQMDSREQATGITSENPVASNVDDTDTAADNNAAGDESIGLTDIALTENNPEHNGISESVPEYCLGEQFHSEDEATSFLLPESSEHAVEDMPVEDATCLIRKHKGKKSHGDTADDPDILMPLSPSKSHNHEAASNALFNEVSRRDERNKPKPGHLSVQRGQILLHTNEGVLATDPALSSSVSSSVSGPSTSSVHSSESDHPPRIGGELAVKDGNIILQTPRSLERNHGQVPIDTSSLPFDGPPYDGHAGEVSSADISSDSGSTLVCSTGKDSDTSSVSSPPRSSILQLSSNSNGASVKDNDTTVMSPSGNNDSEGTARLSGELNVRDGCLVLEPPKHTPSSQILSHLQGAYAAEHSEGTGIGDNNDEVLEPVVNTKRPAGVIHRPPLPKFNSDIVLPFKNQP